MCADESERFRVSPLLVVRFAGHICLPPVRHPRGVARPCRDALGRGDSCRPCQGDRSQSAPFPLPVVRLASPFMRSLRDTSGEPESPISAVRTRVARMTLSGDLTPALEPAALAEARSLAAELETDEGTDGAQVLGWFHWYRHLALGAEIDSEDWRTARSLFTHCFVAGADGVPDQLLPAVVDATLPVALQLLHQVIDEPDPEYISHQVALWERLLRAANAGHPDRPAALSNLAIVRCMRWEHAADPQDLDAAVQASRAAVEATPQDHPARVERLSILASALRARFRHAEELADLELLIDTRRAIADGTPAEDTRFAERMSELAGWLWTWCEQTDSFDELEAALDASVNAVEATPTHSSDFPRYAYNHGFLLWRLHALLLHVGEEAHAVEALNAVIEIMREAVDATPGDDPELGVRSALLEAALEALADQGR